MKKKTIFLTGATGHMGGAALSELLKEPQSFTIRILVLPTQRDRDAIAPVADLENVEVVYGDLCNYDDVLKCVTGADYVLHVGGMVSPAADYHPALTMKVNVDAVKNIIRAIKEQPNAADIRFLYVGSVAETGDRNAPIHWGRTGDPIKISVYDVYAVSKAKAERLVIESGLKHWVVVRQTGILHPSMLDKLDPIMFHEPLNGVFEWATVHDSGVLLAHFCEYDLPEEFFRRIYNIGGGEMYRTVNWEFMQMMYTAVGLGDLKHIMDPRWSATRNFHGQWYTDSDVLESYLHFRSGSVQDFVDDVAKNLSFDKRMAKYAPAWFIRNVVFRQVANKPFGTLYWRKYDVEPRITAFFGSREAWDAIPGWDGFKLVRPSKTPTLLDHGYDESKPLNDLSIEDMQQAARFRGGECLSTEMTKGDLYTPLTWRCAQGHEFRATPALVLLGGFWCEQEEPMPWDYDAEARRNPFFAQVWTPLHGTDEHNYYGKEIINW